MSQHRKFNVDRFLDKLQGHEDILRGFVSQWRGGFGLNVRSLDLPAFKEFLAGDDVAGKDELVEQLHRAYDLCTEAGHEHLIAACDDDLDPDGSLQVECLALKALKEDRAAFDLAYDRHMLQHAERFSVFRGSKPCKIKDPEKAARKFRAKLGKCFEHDKKSDRILIRNYVDGDTVNFVVYHEKRTKAELVFQGSRKKPKVAPTILRPAQQDFIKFDCATGQVAIQARFTSEEDHLRRCFGECCLGDAGFFDGPGAAEWLKLDRIADDDFELVVDDGDSARLLEVDFSLKQEHIPTFKLSSKNALESLELNDLREKLSGGTIRRAVLKLTFPDDGRGKRVTLSGTNKIRFNRTTHVDDVFRYLQEWGLAVA